MLLSCKILKSNYRIDGVFDLTLHYSFEILHGIDDISVIPNLLLEKERFSKIHPKRYINTVKNNTNLINLLPNNWLFLASCQNVSIGINQTQAMASLLSSIKKHVKFEKFQSLSDNDIILSVYNTCEPLLINQIERFTSFCSEKETKFKDQYAKAAKI